MAEPPCLPASGTCAFPFLVQTPLSQTSSSEGPEMPPQRTPRIFWRPTTICGLGPQAHPWTPPSPGAVTSGGLAPDPSLPKARAESGSLQPSPRPGVTEPGKSDLDEQAPGASAGSRLLAWPRDSGVPLPVLNPSSATSPWVDLGKRTGVSKPVSSPTKWTQR